MSLAVMVGATAAVSSAQIGSGGKSMKNMGMNQLQSSFMENKGQWDSRARFRTSRDGMDLWMTTTGVVFDFHQFEKDNGTGGGASHDGGSDTIGFPGGNDETPPNGIDPINTYNKHGQVVRMDFVGATGSGVGQGYNPTGKRMDFFVGDASSHARNVQSYNEAWVKNILPGIHTRGYDSDGSMRYDIIVLPGSHPSSVKFQVKGANSIAVEADGSLTIKTDLGEIKNSKPLIYQPVGDRNNLVQGGWVVNGNIVSFQIGRYDARLPIVIDPLVYGTYLGSDAVPFFSSGMEEIWSCAADSKGNLYMTGWTDSLTFPVTDGPYGIDAPNNMDMFLMRLEGDAYSMDYAALVGGSGDDFGHFIAYNESSGDLWMSGITNSTNFAGATNARTNAIDLVVTKFSIDSNNFVSPNFSRYYGTPGSAAVVPTGGDPRISPSAWPDATATQAVNSDLLVASDGTAYIVGSAPQANLAGFNSFHPQFVGGGRDGFVTRLDIAGNIIDETTFGSTAGDTVGQASLDVQGNLVLTGTVPFAGNQDTAIVPNPVFPTTDGVYTNGRLLRNSDTFVIKMDGAMQTVFSATLGGNNNDGGIAAAFDPGGNIYVLSSTASFDFPRTPGVYDPLYSGEAAVTKISPTGTTILYSTGLGHVGAVSPRTIAVDARGVAVIGGTVAFSGGGLLAPAPTTPGSIPTTGDALDGAYDGGDESVFAPNTPDPEDTGAFRSTVEGFIQFLNPSGTNLLYSDYMGDESDDVVTNVFVDAVGATWIVGFSETVFNQDGEAKEPAGMSAYITGNAFKQGFNGYDGWSVKLRVGLPILSNVTFAPDTIAGGLGASSTATIALREPAPVGGVTLTATLENSAASSFAATPGDTTRVVTIPAGQQVATLQVFSLPVAAQTSADLRVVLDNDFKLARLTVRPWLDDFSVSPATVVGGNQVTARVRLFQAAITDIAVAVSTDRTDLITLPNPPQIIVPAGATTVNVLLDTAGVDTTQNATLTTTLLGVGKTAPVTLTPATLSAILFNPDRVNGGDNSNMTIQLNGKTGSARVVDVDVVSGPAGLLIDGSAVPTQVTIPAQSNSGTYVATAPIVPAPTSVVVRASEGGIDVDGTLFIDDIDIASINFVPATDVVSGTVLDGTVTLSREAGPDGFTVDLTTSNPDAGTLSTTTVTIPAGATTSPTFQFTAAVVATDQTTTVSASRPGYTTRSVDITVRAITATLAMNPASVVGGFQNSTGTITLSDPAPPTGIQFAVTSNNPAVTVPATVTVAGGATTATFTATTTEVNAAQTVTIRAEASAVVFDTADLVVTPVALGLSLDPTSVLGGDSSTGTVTIGLPAPAGGFTLTLTSSNAAATVPGSVTIAEGETSATFVINTTKVAADVSATITATTPAGTTATAVLQVRAPAIISFFIDPTLVVGPDSTFGTVTIETTAGPGGVPVQISDDNANASAPATVVIPEGQDSVTFEITTNSVAFDQDVNVTASIGSSVATASFTILAPSVASLTFSPPRVTGGQSSVGTVTLDRPAPVGGLVVTLVSDNPALARPLVGTVTVPAGSRTATFNVTTSAVSRYIAVGFHATTPNTDLIGYLYIKP